MKPLTVLLTVFVLALGISRLAHGQFEFALCARIAMAVMLAFTSMGHFVYTKGMIMMVPRVVPFKKTFVYATGIFELLASIGLLFDTTFRDTSLLIIIFYVLMLPANINAAQKKVDFQKATTTGNGVKYLWFRVPLQILFILWVYYSGIKN